MSEIRLCKALLVLNMCFGVHFAGAANYYISRYFLLLLLVFLFPKARGQECPVIPLPADVQLNSGEFLLDWRTTIESADSSLYPLAWKLQKMMFEETGYALAVRFGPLLNASSAGDTDLARNAGFGRIKSQTPETSQPIILLKPLDESKLGENGTAGREEAYRLSVSPEKIVIEAGDEAGFFYGIVSLVQLAQHSAQKLSANAPAIPFPCWQIEDAPFYSWRGLMLDEARHFFGKEKIKEVLDQMAYYKLNRFHWHLTDVQGWRIGIRGYPWLTLVGGIGNRTDPYAPAKFYTQEDIAEIVRYAGERHIEIIPEIDMPGHAGAANRAYPEYKGMHREGRSAYTFNPGKEGTYRYLSEILREIDVLFPWQMIHLGGDEVSMGNKQWAEDPAVRELMKNEDLTDLQAVEHYFIRRMADSVNLLGNTVLAWDEVVNAGLSPENTLIFWWRPDKPEQLSKALNKGYRTILCPREPLYFSLVQDNAQRWGKKLKKGVNDLESVYKFPGTNVLVPEGKKELISGLQANVWTEFIHNGKRLDYMLFPRMIALAEAAWSQPERKNYGSFMKRLPSRLRQLDKDGVYYYNPFRPELHPEPPGPGQKN